MKPMLAAVAPQSLSFPLLASPKLDGVRCLVLNGVAVGRSLKAIPNKHVQKLFGRPELDGLDGELIVGGSTAANAFNVTSSGVMSVEGEPDVYFHVFDDFRETGGFQRRLHTAHRRIKKCKRCVAVPHRRVANAEELDKLEQMFLAQGYEGVMLRSLDGPYKQGRSTAKEGHLLKLKRFVDGEAEVLGFEQLMRNTNEAKTNELGQKERSNHKAGMVGAGTLGALKVRDLKTAVEFSIGSGFDAEQRATLWAMRHALAGRVLKYKSQPVGAKDKPRFPVFLGFRDAVDM